MVTIFSFSYCGIRIIDSRLVISTRGVLSASALLEISSDADQADHLEGAVFFFHCNFAFFLDLQPCSKDIFWTIDVNDPFYLKLKISFRFRASLALSVSIQKSFLAPNLVCRSIICHCVSFRIFSKKLRIKSFFALQLQIFTLTNVKKVMKW